MVDVRLMLAAHELQLPYNSALRLVLTGALRGQQVRGRWYVDRDSLTALKRHFAKERTAAQ